jgi:ABC-type transporter Mla maintaining outer membrane lipid asymmetry ATPase subunit MlaF
MYPGLHENLNVTLSWHHLGCQIKDKKVLKDISGIASPGQVTALLGPSGIIYIYTIRTILIFLKRSRKNYIFRYASRKKECRKNEWTNIS